MMKDCSTVQQSGVRKSAIFIPSGSDTRRIVELNFPKYLENLAKGLYGEICVKNTLTYFLRCFKNQ